jgi:hypothetical protein
MPSALTALLHNRYTNLRIVREEDLLIVEITALAAEGENSERG